MYNNFTYIHAYVDFKKWLIYEIGNKEVKDSIPCKNSMYMVYNPIYHIWCYIIYTTLCIVYNTIYYIWHYILYLVLYIKYSIYTLYLSLSIIDFIKTLAWDIISNMIDFSWISNMGHNVQNDRFQLHRMSWMSGPMLHEIL